MKNIKFLIGKIIKIAAVQGYLPSQQTDMMGYANNQDALSYQKDMQEGYKEDIPNVSFKNPGQVINAPQAKNPMYNKYNQSHNSRSTPKQSKNI